MTTLKLKSALPTLKNALLFMLIAVSPFMLVYLGTALQALKPSMGLLDPGILQLLLLSLICFLGTSALAWWLVQRAWNNLGLPKIKQMVLQFNTLTVWQQFALYWASFALLLLAAVLSLVAMF